ncbi:MAG: SseB family protein, partial [Lachnospiraceae bacterium]|nr:SseB family protein [Lachnospiraceae bacterium]
GSLLKAAIHKFHEGDQTDGLFEICQILRDSYVWIPCSAVVGEEDQKTVEQMIAEAGDDLDSMVGKEFTTQGNIRLVPDILQRGDEHFFPVFSTEEDMGEYGEHFSKMQQHFLQVIGLARNHKEYEGGLTGIVINAFTEPFVLPQELYEAVEKMVSRVEDPEE